MKLLIRRRRATAGMLGGKQKFEVEVRAELTPEEKQAFDGFKLGSTTLFETPHRTMNGLGLVAGSTFAADTFEDAVALEQMLRTGAGQLSGLISRAAEFEGEEVVEL